MTRCSKARRGSWRRAWSASAIAAAALALASAGCTAEAGGSVGVIDDRPPPGGLPPATFGTLTVYWTIEGAPDPVLCDLYGAAAFELVVYDSVGRFFTEAEAPCAAFSLTVELPDGFYDADATLVDAFDNAESETLPLFDLDVVGGTDLAVDTDFPAGSML